MKLTLLLLVYFGKPTFKGALPPPTEQCILERTTRMNRFFLVIQKLFFFLVIQKHTMQAVYSRTNDSNEPVLFSDSKAFFFFSDSKAYDASSVFSNERLE